MKKLIVAMLLFMFITTSFALSPSANNARTTFRNGFAWGGNMPHDKATLWAQQVEAAAEIGQGLGTGKVFYVDSGVANEGDGGSWDTAFDTLDEGIGACTANRGDFILVAQGHAETMGTASVNVDIAGITILGLGNANLRPTFTFDTATDTFAIAATGDNVTIANLRFVAGVTVVAAGIDVLTTVDGLSIIECEWAVTTAGTHEFEDCIIFAATCDDALIANCLFDGGAVTNADSDSGIHFLGSDNITIVGNQFFGDYSVACIENITTASNFITIASNIMYNGIIGGTAGLNTVACINLKSDTSGVIIGNEVYTNVATPELAIVAADCFLARNVYSETEGAVSPPPMWLTTDTVLNLIGVDDASNLGVTTNVTGDADGSLLERLEYSQAVVLGSTTIAGQRYVTTVTTSDANDNDLFDIAGGAIIVDQFIGLITTNIVAAAGAMKIQLDADAGWVNHDLSTAVEMNGDLAGQRIMFTDANPSVLTPVEVASGGSSTLMSPWYVGEGMLEMDNADEDATGIIQWIMVWTPVDNGTTVTAHGDGSSN